MTRRLTTLLIAACWLLNGCAALNSAQPTPSMSSLIPPEPTGKKLLQVTKVYDPMTPVSYKPMSAVITPRLPQCPPLHWEASNGWGGLVISGPALETLDFYNTGCPQYPRINVARVWLTDTADYLLPYEGKTEFAKIIPFETE